MQKINITRQFIYAVLTASMLLFCLDNVQAADSQKRLALVIGNSAYQGNAFLEHPVNDARELAEVLKKLDFEIFKMIPQVNLRRDDMQSVIEQFAEKLRGNGGIGLFYFAGHGLQFEGENYLVPIGEESVFDTEDEDEKRDDLDRKTVKVSEILGKMQAADSKFLILDACHDNPFRDGGIETQRGLTPIKKIPEGTLIAYAAKPGEVVTENNPYTKHLISEIQKPGLSVTQVFVRVQVAVLEETGGLQKPKYYPKELNVDFYFVGDSDTWLKTLYFLGVIVIIAIVVVMVAVIGWRVVRRQKVVDVLPAEHTEEKKKESPQDKIFEFDVITVNTRGDELTRTRKKARYYTENLPNGVTLEMVYIPESTFLMGKYTVTQAQWKAIMGNNNPSEFKGDNRPVENVTYEMAQTFCKRISEMTGKTYRLPSETEWEYACSAGTKTPFHFGETMTTELANYDGDYTYASELAGVDRKETTEVGCFPANAFGLYDMHGNIWEWTANENRVVQRGGSWNNPPGVARSWYRLMCEPSDKPKNNVGFRLVQEGGNIRTSAAMS